MTETLHPRPLVGKMALPIEHLPQVYPADLPEPSEEYPGPWRYLHRGNGHYSLYDQKDRLFAHVYVFDAEEDALFDAALAKAAQWKAS